MCLAIPLMKMQSWAKGFWARFPSISTWSEFLSFCNPTQHNNVQPLWEEAALEAVHAEAVLCTGLGIVLDELSAPRGRCMLLASPSVLCCAVLCSGCVGGASDLS